MLRASYTKKISNSAHIDADDLTRLTEQLAKVGPVEYEIECANGEELKTSDLGEVVHYENAKGSHIVSMTLRSYGDRPFSSSASVSFEPGLYGGVELSLKEDSELVGKLRGNIQKIVSGMKPPYWWLHYFSFGATSFVVIFGYFVFTLLRQAWFPSTRPPEKPEPSSNEVAYALVIVLSVFATVVGAGFAIDWALRKICPKVVFMIGQGAKRYKVLHDIQWTVLVGGLVSIATSVLLYFVL